MSDVPNYKKPSPPLPRMDVLTYPEVTRVEVISQQGREMVYYDVKAVKVVIQDGGKTLKVMLERDLPDGFIDDTIPPRFHRFTASEETGVGWPRPLKEDAPGHDEMGQ